MGNTSLRERLGWNSERYWAIRNELVQGGFLRLGRGRGGSIIRVIDPDEQAMLARVPSDGSPLGNISLRGALGWPEDKYWKVRNTLVDRGELVRGGGKGGSVRRSVDPEENADDVRQGAQPSPQQEAPRERDSYEPLASVLRTTWAKERGLEQWVVQVTAYQGRRQTNGRWSRPDLTLVGKRTFELTAQHAVDVFTFEVKYGWCDITAVYEALSHSGSSHYSYLVLVVPDRDQAQFITAIEQEADHHGIGLIVTSDAANFEEWDERKLPERKETDPGNVEDFLKTQLSAETLDKIRQWHERGAVRC